MNTLGKGMNPSGLTAAISMKQNGQEAKDNF